MIRPRMVWRVAWRDLLTTLRDTRALLSAVLVPLLVIPLLTLGMPLLLEGLVGGQRDTVQRVGLVGELPPELHDILVKTEKGKSGVELVSVSESPVEAVRSGKVDMVIEVKGHLPTHADQSGQVVLYAKKNNLKVMSGAYTKVGDALDAYNTRLTQSRLAELGLSKTVLAPISVKTEDASPEGEQRSGQLAFLIPMLMLSFVLSGAMATALDATAGEKERGTLESLLVTPVRRSEMVVGKLVATTLMALSAATFSLCGFLLTGLLSAALLSGARVAAAEAMGGQLTLSPDGLLVMFLIVTSAAFVVSGLLITLGIYARSYKEAQTYTSPLGLLIVFPSIGLQFADFLTLPLSSYAVPLLGGMLALLEVVRGSVSWMHAALAVAGNLFGAAVLAWLAWLSFGREEVVFRNE